MIGVRSGRLAWVIGGIVATGHVSPAAALSPSGSLEPKLLVGDLVQPGEYPSLPMRMNQSGRTELALNVDPSGAVVGCDLVATSGSDALDDRTCAIFVVRARFSPAANAGGSVPATIVQHIDWRLTGAPFLSTPATSEQRRAFADRIGPLLAGWRSSHVRREAARATDASSASR